MASDSVNKDIDSKSENGEDSPGETINVSECDSKVELHDDGDSEALILHSYEGMVKDCAAVSLKVTIEKTCDICSEKRQAESFCRICQDALCIVCTEEHKIIRSTRDHTIVDIAELMTDTNKMCGICSESSKNVEAVSYCEDCPEYLCSDCTEKHKVLNPTRNHAVVKLDMKCPDKYPCEVCTELGKGDVDASSYCQECDQNLCEDCVEQHKRIKSTRNHLDIPISEKVSNNKIEICRNKDSERIKQEREWIPAPDTRMKEEKHLTDDTKREKTYGSLDTMEMILNTNMATLRLVLMGKTGSGKSSTGNTIIGREVFKSMTSAASVTNACQKHEATINRRKVAVVDTPGFFDTNVPQEKLIQEISRYISMTTPGPHAFLFVIGLGRFTGEEINAVELFVKQFGENVKDYIIVVFSRADDLGGRSIDSFLAEATPRLQDFIKSCGNRYVTIDNKNKPKGQVSRLFDLINKTVEKNGNKHYTNAMYEENLEMLRVHEEDLEKERAEKEARKMKQTEEIYRAKMSAEIEKYQEQYLEQQRHIENDFREINNLNESLKDKSALVRELSYRIEEKNRFLEEKQRQHEDTLRTLKLDMEKMLQQNIQSQREKLNIKKEELDIKKKKYLRNQSDMVRQMSEDFEQKLKMQNAQHQKEIQKLQDDKLCVIH